MSSLDRIANVYGRYRRSVAWPSLLIGGLMLINGCGGGGGGGDLAAYLGRSFSFHTDTRSLSISVDPSGRFTIAAQDRDSLADGSVAQGVVSQSGIVAAQSDDGLVQFDGAFASNGTVFTCSVRSGNTTLFTVDATRVADGTPTSGSLVGSYRAVDPQKAYLSLDSWGHAVVWVVDGLGGGGGLTDVATDGSLASYDGQFEGHLDTGGSQPQLHVTKLRGATVSITVPLQTAARAKWTFMVYLNAANDLQTFGPLNVNQMEKVGSTSDVNIVVQWKQANCSTCGSPQWVSTRRYYVRRDTDTSRVTSPVIEDLGPNVDMGDWRQLYSFVSWAQKRYPADRYALVIWNHGAGWRNTRAGMVPALRSVSIDDSTQNEIQTWQLPQALSVTPKLDLLIFDASLMQMVEVAYEVRNAASIMVGSEESPPGEGYVYDTFLSDLAQEPGMTPAMLAESIVVRTIESYGSSSNITQSALDLSRIEDVAQRMDAFARLAIFYSSTYGSALSAIRRDAESYLYRDNKDLWHYADVVRTSTLPADLQAAASNLQQAVADAVMVERHGSLHPNSHGIAVYVPDPSSYLLTYANLALSRVTQWDEWLRAQPPG